MECRTLEITSIWAKDLKDVHIFSKMEAYVVVMVANDPSSMQKTPVDKLGGTSPHWICSIKFTINEDASRQNRLALHFQLKSNGVFGAVKDIGEVYVPIKDLFNGEDFDEGGEKIAESFDVENPSGKAKGTLSFTYKIGEQFVVENMKKTAEPLPHRQFMSWKKKYNNLVLACGPGPRPLDRKFSVCGPEIL
ncbi:hypothetical protein L1049_020892 [Liquidambar formosana]|uniref:C2 domain-containing protein n=1 Tax=Liquidambar formosana TaxID=63359 RepID=A0AAP0S8N2_LIQFO